MIRLVHMIGVSVTAGWAQTGAQAQRMSAMGCDNMQ
jgi:EAL domain-containing protein (putative c-di-GMP-specific phosphodiesterase class I)